MCSSYFYVYVFRWLRKWDEDSERNSQGEQESTFALRNEERKEKGQLQDTKKSSTGMCSWGIPLMWAYRKFLAVRPAPAPTRSFSSLVFGVWPGMGASLISETAAVSSIIISIIKNNNSRISRGKSSSPFSRILHTPPDWSLKQTWPERWPWEAPHLQLVRRSSTRARKSTSAGPHRLEEACVHWADIPEGQF